jgi:hypothetical protein
MLANHDELEPQALPEILRSRRADRAVLGRRLDTLRAAEIAAERRRSELHGEQLATQEELRAARARSRRFPLK